MAVDEWSRVAGMLVWRRRNGPLAKEGGQPPGAGKSKEMNTLQTP